MRTRRLYAIADVETLRRRRVGLRKFAEGLLAAGVEWVQLRDKGGNPREVLDGARVLREVFAGTGCRLVMNDRVDLAVIAGFDGVHVGQGDLGVEDARRVVGAERSFASANDTPPFDGEAFKGWGTRLVGVSTHTEEQVRVADGTSADYVAIGPVFATGTKADAAAVVGLGGVRRARELTGKPLVAIGGITRENARSVVEAGADGVAVISGLLVEGESVDAAARDFLRILR